MLESLNYSFRNPKNIIWVIYCIKQLRYYKKNHGVLRGTQLDKQRWRARLGILRVNVKETSLWVSRQHGSVGRMVGRIRRCDSFTDNIYGCWTHADTVHVTVIIVIIYLIEVFKKSGYRIPWNFVTVLKSGRTTSCLQTETHFLVSKKFFMPLLSYTLSADSSSPRKLARALCACTREESCLNPWRTTIYP